MITKEEFIKLMQTVINLEKEFDRWSDFGIDLFEMKISELISTLYDYTFKISFTDEGVDWIYWWLFESESNKAYNSNGIELPTETIEDMWEIVKNYIK